MSYMHMEDLKMLEERGKGGEAVPALKTELCYFAACLAKERLKHHTIRAYCICQKCVSSILPKVTMIHSSRR